MNSRLEIRKREIELLKLVLEIEKATPAEHGPKINSTKSAVVQRCLQALGNQNNSDSRTSIAKSLRSTLAGKGWKTLLARIAVGNVGLACWMLFVFGHGGSVGASSGHPKLD